MNGVFNFVLDPVTDAQPPDPPPEMILVEIAATNVPQQIIDRSKKYTYAQIYGFKDNDRTEPNGANVLVGPEEFINQIVFPGTGAPFESVIEGSMAPFDLFDMWCEGVEGDGLVIFLWV